MLGQVGFESLGEFAPGQQNAPPTAFALEPDIRAQPRDGSLVGTAWMLFAQTQVVIETQVR